MEFKPNYPLDQLTTFRIGGECLFYAEAASIEEIKQALIFAKEKNLPVFILGNGSNIVISDEGFAGLVIHNQIKGLKIESSGFVTISAGENWDDVVSKLVEKNLAGVECLSGIPGSSGGALVQNIGAYGQTLGNLVQKVQAIEIESGESKTFSNAQCQFSYRSSLFKTIPNNYIVVEFELQLIPNGDPMINYPHVEKHFQNKQKPSLAQLREFIIKLRASKGYLIMPGYENYLTAGSFFKNPIVSREQFEKLKPILGDPSLNRFWPMPNGVKIAAAFLMQEAGFSKGYKEGNVGISPKHSLSLINLGNAKASEVRELAEKIKGVVLERFGIKLEEEVLYV